MRGERVGTEARREAGVGRRRKRRNASAAGTRTLFRIRLHEELILPRLESLERRRLREVEDKQAHVSAAVERMPQGLEPLLPRCVPDLRGEKARQKSRAHRV